MLKRVLSLIVVAAVVSTASAKETATLAMPTKNGSAVAWVKSNKKAIIASASLVALAGVAVVADKYFECGYTDAALNAINKAYDYTKNGLVDGYTYTSTKVVDGYTYASTSVVDGYTYSKEAVCNNPKTSASVVALVVMAAAAIADVKRGEKSYVLAIYNKILSAAKAQDATINNK